MEDSSIDTRVKQKMSKGTKRAFILMAILLTLSMTTTIVLAAFQASKTSTATLTFANGIKLALTKTGTSGTTIQIGDAAAAVTGTFTYAATSGNSMTNLNGIVNMDGIIATVSEQTGFLAYSILVKKGTASGTASAIAGSWTAAGVFTPQATAEKWKVYLTLPASTWTGTATSNAATAFKLKQSSSTAIATGGTITLFSKLVIAGTGSATDANVTALGGMKVEFEFKVCADTVSAANALAAV